MKRIVFVMLIALAVTAAVSAQDYIVQEVIGRVERNTGGNNWTAINVGDTLKADTVVKTVIGANLTVKKGDDVLVVGPMKNGKLGEVASASSGIQIQGRVSQTDTSATSRSTGRLSTASARASEATDLED